MPDTAPTHSTPSAAGSVAEILARMQANGELQSDLASLLASEPGAAAPAGAPRAAAAAEAQPPAARGPAPTPPETRSAAPRAGHHEGEESDISEYMQRLLKRHGAPSAPPTVPTAPQASEANSNEAPAESLTPWNPEEYVPRAVAPEKNWNLNALREVANQSNRCALEQSALNRVQAQVNLFRTAAIVAAGFGLMFLVLGGFRFSFPLVLGVISFAGAGWAYWHMQQLYKRCVANAVPAAEPATADSKEAAPAADEPADESKPSA